MRAVAVDAMGGDHAPLAIVQGAVECARLDQIPIHLVGDEAQIKALVHKLGASDQINQSILSIVPSECVVAMDDKPSGALRKKGSSMHVACDLVVRGEACGALSAGNSGAMMAIATLQIGRVDGVIRPAIAALFPSQKGYCVVTDAGANVDCTPEMLVQFALLGTAFSKGFFGIENPRVAVVSNGEEEGKGTDLTRAALAKIREASLLCDGYCEGRDIFEGRVDVAVCDGFTGNVLLKTAEGTAKHFARLIKDSVESSSVFVRLGALLMRPAFKRVRSKMDPREYGAAPLLGLKAPVFIAHGNSDSYAIRKAIQFVARSYKGNVTDLTQRTIV